MASKAKVPPHSKKAERSVLGSLLLSKDAMIDVAEIIAPEMFYEDKHERIYEAIRTLYEEREPIDMVTVSEWLKKKDYLKSVGGSSYLSELVNSVPTAAHAKGYAKIIKEHYIKRQMIESASELVEMAFDEGAEVREVLDKAEKEVFGLSQKNIKGGFVPVKDALAESFDRLDELHKRADGMRGVPTGFSDLDDSLAGMQDSNLLVLAARPGVGKCVTGDTLIPDPGSGQRVPIKKMVEKKEGKIVSLGEKYKLETGEPSRFVDDGEKQVFKITTALGNQLKATAVHPLLTIKGWRRVEELEEGERVAVPRQLPYFGRLEWPDYKVKALAYFLGDGGLTNSSPMFTNSQAQIRQDFKQAVKRFEGVKVSEVKQTGDRVRTTSLRVAQDMGIYQEYKERFASRLRTWLEEIQMSQRQLALSLSVSPATVCMWAGGQTLPGAEYAGKLEKLWGERLEKVARVNPVTEWLEELGVMGKSAGEKSIPDKVFELDRDNLALFLNRLYACDGSVVINEKGQRVRVSYSSSSKELAEQVKHLLLRFGILASLREKKVRYKGGRRLHYEVEVMGARQVLKFIDKIGIYGSEKKLQRAKKIVLSKLTSKNYTKDTLPMGVWDIILKEKGQLSWRQVYKKMGKPGSHNIHCKRREPRRETVEAIGEALRSQKLLDLARSDVYWDRIVSIKPAGREKVYDLSVKGLRNFVAGDMVVHNTTLALNIAQNAAVEEKIPVGFFSLEMSNLELVDRLLVAQAKIDAWKMKTGNLKEEEFTKLSEAMGVLADSPLYIDDTPGLSILEMRTKARRLQVEKGVKLIVVDYLQLAVGDARYESRVQEVQAISQGLKNLARELKIPVLALSQLNRAIEQRGSKVPQLSDLRESGSIEQDSDVVMFLYRPNDEDLKNYKLSIAKHRNGPLGTIDLVFKNTQVRFFGASKKGN